MGHASSVVQCRIPSGGEIGLTRLVNNGAYCIHNPCCAVLAHKPVFQARSASYIGRLARFLVGPQAQSCFVLLVFVLRFFVLCDDAMGSVGDRDFLSEYLATLSQDGTS